MKKIIGYFAENSLIVNLISIALIIAGVMYLMSTNREAFPKIDFDWVLVETIYPGATASDVEKLVTIPIEDQLREINGIKEIMSSSLEARSSIGIQLDPDLENKDKTINDIRSAIDRISDLPDDAETPLVTELTMQSYPVVAISLINKNGIHSDKDEFELRAYAKNLENRLMELNGVASVSKQGYREREMIVEVRPDLLQQYHVAVNDVILALKSKNINFPGGIAKQGNEELLIRTIGEVETAAEVAAIPIRSNDLGNIVRIGDVARVRDSFATARIINNTQGKQSITLTILKKDASDIIKLVDSVVAEVDKYKTNLPDNYDIVYTDDLSVYVKRRLEVLIGNGIVGFVLVNLVLFLALGWRISLVTAVGLPLAFCGTFLWMGMADVTINLMSMFGLIMVLGMLVDDAIVVAENIYRYLEEGYPLKDAVVEGTNEVILPVAGTILTTLAAFAPLLFMSGIMGKFVWVLPAVVSVALIFSWIESMFILPAHIYDIEKRNPNRNRESTSEAKTSPLRVRERYTNILRVVVSNRYIAIGILLLLFVGSIGFAIAKVKFILFPGGDIEILYVTAECPSGITLDDMNKKIGLLEKVVAGLPETELESYVSRTGIIAQEPNDPNTKYGTNYGCVLINLTPFTERDRTAIDIIEELRKNSESIKGEFSKLEFQMVKNGPPTGMPVSVSIKGDDFATLSEIAAQYKAELAKIEGLKDIKDNLEDRKNEVQIYVKPEIAARTGITVYDVASTVRSCYDGTVATKIRKTDEEIDIRVIFPQSLRDNLASIYSIEVSNYQGKLIPLRNIADFKRSDGISNISRKSWRRNVTVTADIDEKAEQVTSVTVNSILMQKFADIENRYPGYTIDYEGEFKDTEESVTDLVRSFIIAALAIYIILVALFKTLHHPMLVMSVIPFTAIGVIWAFFFHGMPLSFMAMMGIVGLAGVVVNDSIVYVEFINNLRHEGKTPFDAAIEAGGKRIRPIILTTITTVFGLFPTAYGIGGFDPFLKPMAISMSWGLLFGTMITLFAIPALYVIFYDVRSIFCKSDKFRHTCPDTTEQMSVQLPVPPIRKGK